MVITNHGDRKSPFSRVVPLPNGRFMAEIHGCDLITTYIQWDDHPSRGSIFIPPFISLLTTWATRLGRVKKPSKMEVKSRPTDRMSKDTLPETNIFAEKQRLEYDRWVVVSNIFYFHPYLGKIPILTNIFQRG